ncbi:3'-5' exonuclease [Leeuwenhoekiella sp. A16]|uniref:3'-5' exonuclease n=1 Tax=unclassified Leeuwenhoekiella TaxID=2615029 RepID=UPI003A80DB3B
MLKRIKLENILFLDIETVPEVKSFGLLSEEMQQLYADKTKYQRKEEFTAEEFYDRAGIWAEFGKIICLSVGYFKIQGENRNFRTTSFSGEEEEILREFKTLLETHFNKPQNVLCAHNGKEFDYPFIARRMIIHSIELPFKLNFFGKKPWEVPHLDTLELWKFGDYKHYTSLKLLTKILNIPSPKTDIDGSEVRDVFYEENDLNRIVLYCERDVVAVAQIILRLRNEKLLDDAEIISV